MNDVNLTFKINKIHLSLIILLLIMVAVILIVRGDIRENLPKVLPVGTEVKAIILNVHSGQADPFNNNQGYEILFVQFQDSKGNAGSETHYVEALINFNKPAPQIKEAIVSGVKNESHSLKYNLTEVIFMSDFTKTTLPKQEHFP